jgi:hypothetical protein
MIVAGKNDIEKFHLMKNKVKKLFYPPATCVLRICVEAVVGLFSMLTDNSNESQWK